jgi:transposase
MEKAKFVSLEVQKLIVEAVEEGMSYQKVADRFEVSKSGVRHIFQRYKLHNKVVIGKRSKRPRQTDQRTENFLVRLSKEDPSKSFVDL